ncbi:prephenate dehydrogenase [Aquimarina agarilytica]|uniref:prephenate dehydrogenase n=1 Tax=Aquimarina agarilytica TaxID=1087449 RepID=UPI000289AD99|nr:prephenate dehydrogenase [Aquimarina agarilytica]
MKVFVIGVGLIGGSLVTDIKVAYKDAIVYGIDANESNLATAISLGFVDKSATFANLYEADVVILAIPVDIAQIVLPQVLDKIEDHCLVFDVGSTKEKLCNQVSKHSKRACYLAAHPIAGTEFSGPKAALANLFRGKANIICEVEKTGQKQVEFALDIFDRLGMRIRYMDAASHDKHIAYVSHLSHVSSFMLGKTVIEKEKNERDIFDMAGSGFASTVRLAKSSPAMWTPIFKQNKENVIGALQEYIDNLTAFKALMEAGNDEDIFNEMKDTNRIKTILQGIE